VQLIDFIETARNLKVATTNYDTVSMGRGGKEKRENCPPSSPKKAKIRLNEGVVGV
jgi:hypothetical protein